MRPEVADRHELIRRANIEMVFRAISKQAPVNRVELVRSTGLSKPTVLSVVAALQEEGLVRQTSMAPLRSSAGRIPVAYEANPQAAYVVGVDLGGSKTAVALADLSGVLLATREDVTTRKGGPAVVQQISRLARDVAAQAGVPWRRVDGITVGTPGVENRDGTIRMADNVRGLGSLKVAAALRRSLRTDVRLENDVNLAAIGEFEQGVARTCTTFVLVAIGTGIGMGLIVDGRLLHGARGGAGEIAYLPLGADPAGSDARRRGAFELAASGSGVQDILRAEWRDRRRRAGTTLRPTSTAREVYAAAALGDAIGIRVVDRHAAVVAEAVLAVASVIDPELVVIGGGIGANPVLLQPLRDAVARICPWPLRVETSALGTNAGVIGAVHHALRSLPEIESARVSARLQTGEPR